MANGRTPSPAAKCGVAAGASWRGMRLHLVLEIFGGHFLEDFGPFVPRNTGEVLVGNGVFGRIAGGLVQFAGDFEDGLGYVDRRFSAQSHRDRVGGSRVDMQRTPFAGLELDAGEVG